MVVKARLELRFSQCLSRGCGQFQWSRAAIKERAWETSATPSCLSFFLLSLIIIENMDKLQYFTLGIFHVTPNCICILDYQKKWNAKHLISNFLTVWCLWHIGRHGSSLLSFKSHKGEAAPKCVRGADPGPKRQPHGHTWSQGSKSQGSRPRLQHL